MTDKIVVLSTCASVKEATRIATELVEKRLAACVNLVSGVRSVYRWKNKIEKSQEVLLVIKTSRALFENVRSQIEKLHSYELPEVIALPLVDGAEQYLEWIDRVLEKSTPGSRTERG
jgi:periplasmic divalent cation tolerance protein